jgi:hypothetical protein
MAAFFAINIDIYPVNGNGKLSLGYVLKYMCKLVLSWRFLDAKYTEVSISGAVSIPFVLVAFNQEKIGDWMKARGKQSAVWTMILVILTVLLSVIWTGGLASDLKGVITVALVFLVLLSALGHGLQRLIAKASRDDNSSDGSSSRSGSE